MRLAWLPPAPCQQSAPGGAGRGRCGCSMSRPAGRQAEGRGAAQLSTVRRHDDRTRWYTPSNCTHAGKRAGRASDPPARQLQCAGREARRRRAHRQDLRSLCRAFHRGVPPAGILLVGELCRQRQHGLQSRMADRRMLFACVCVCLVGHQTLSCRRGSGYWQQLSSAALPAL